MPPAKRLTPRPRATRKRAAPPVDALAQAAWMEADAALAEALVECGRAIQASASEAREEALELLSQALARAARRRGLSRVGKSGAFEAFDPDRHELPASAKPAPKRVRVVVEGVARGGEVLIRARAAPVGAKRR
jgi:hypothetical protein